MVGADREMEMNSTGGSSALVWFGDPQGSCTGCNDEWLAWRGRALEDELGLGWLEGVHPADRAMCAMTLARHSALHAPVEMEFRLQRHDGLWRPMLVVGVPRVDFCGEFCGLTCSLIDATDHLQARRAGRAQQALLRATLEAAQDSDLVGTAEGASVHRIATFLATERHPVLEQVSAGLADLASLADLRAPGADHRRHPNAGATAAVVACRLEDLPEPASMWMQQELQRITAARLASHLRALDIVIDCQDGIVAAVLSGECDERGAEATIEVLHEVLEHPVEIGGHTCHPSLRFTYVMQGRDEDLPACVDRARQALGPAVARTG